MTNTPPEFLRQGRFDEKFYVGLPTSAERRTILAIHLARRKRDPASFDLEALSSAAGSFSGAQVDNPWRTF